MQRVALIDNRASGQHSDKRTKLIREALAVFEAAGVKAELFEPSRPGGATVLARQAIQQGFDTILACGGDGTVHEILQGMVGTEAALGVIPFGTANALAADLGLIASPAKVASRLLQAEEVRVPVGRIHYRDSKGNQRARFFLVAAGIGADALLMTRLDARLKRKLGYILYLIEAFRIWATNPFPLFEVVFNRQDGSPAHHAQRPVEISQLLAVRVRSFGGVLQELAPGASLRGSRLRVLAFGTRSRFRFLKFTLAVLFRRHSFDGTIQLQEADSVECRPRNGSRRQIFVEADGEVLGSLPVRIEMVQDALTLLIPRNARP
jgi:YegS/Rv2252/BmrU family lipid kinase